MIQLDLVGRRETQSSYRAQILKSHAEFRREWQEITEGQSLIDVDAPVGLLLADIADRLEFSPQERYVMLRSQLTKDVNSFLEERIRATLP